MSEYITRIRPKALISQKQPGQGGSRGPVEIEKAKRKLPTPAKVERVEQVRKCRPVDGNVRVARFCDRVGEIVPATIADGTHVPVPLDEFVDRNVVTIAVRNMAAGRILGNDQQRNARAIAEKVQRLHVTRVIVSAAFIEGDEDCGVVPVRRILDIVDDLLAIQLEYVELRR
jgi:hypothetical protein